MNLHALKRALQSLIASMFLVVLYNEKNCYFSENQARNLLKNDSKSKQETSGEILNNQGMMEYHRQKGELSIEFRNMVSVGQLTST